MIAAGTLNIPITIEQAPEMRGSTGQKKLDWANATIFCQRRAKLEPGRGREFQAAEITVNERLWTITCRGRAEIVTTMRVRTSDGRTMGILDLFGTDGKPPKTAAMIKLLCRESTIKTG